MKDEKNEPVKAGEVDKSTKKSEEQIEKEKFANDVQGFGNELKLILEKYNMALRPIITEVGPQLRLSRPIKQEEKKSDIIK